MRDIIPPEKKQDKEKVWLIFWLGYRMGDPLAKMDVARDLFDTFYAYLNLDLCHTNTKKK